MNINTLALLAAAVAPAITIMVYFYSKDKGDREPFSILLISFICGCFSVLPAIILETALPEIIPSSQGATLLSVGIFTFGIVAMSEEFCKYIFLRYYAYKRHSFNEPYDGIIYAVMVGMGFATIENLMYVFGADTAAGQWGSAGFRAITAVPAHATFAAVMGYYVGLAKFNKSNERSLLFRGFILAVLLHGFYDFCLFQNLTWGLTLGALVSLVVGIRFSRRAIKLHKANPLSKSHVISTEPVVDNFDSPARPS